MRDYGDAPRVSLQYCHIPTDSAYAKLLAETERKEKGGHRLPDAFPCVTTGSLVAHPQQHRTFTPRERCRAQGIDDNVRLQWQTLSPVELFKEHNFVRTRRSTLTALEH